MYRYVYIYMAEAEELGNIYRQLDSTEAGI